VTIEPSALHYDYTKFAHSSSSSSMNTIHYCRFSVFSVYCYEYFHHLPKRLFLLQLHCLLFLLINLPSRQQQVSFLPNVFLLCRHLPVLYLPLLFRVRKRVIRRLKRDIVPILTLVFKVCVWPYLPYAFLKIGNAGRTL
jgi:hypothetical protein